MEHIISERKKRAALSPNKQLGKRSVIALAVNTVLAVCALPVLAQEQPKEAPEEIEIIDVRGVAEAYRNAIAEKRNSSTIVDALSSADIGALPDLSVGETLERITGVAGDRFKGNASEISIRGLGPFLGFSTVNGRTISSGSGTRAVAFSQFPSELVNGVVVYKAQTAKLQEGGVAGTIDLKTIKPVDFGKERFQAEVRLNYNEYHARIDGENGLGYRPAISYTNSYELENDAEFGFAIGYSGTRVSTPEESYNTSATIRNCNSDFALDGGSNCSFNSSNARSGDGDPVDGELFFVPNQQLYRQMTSEEERDGFLFALQYKLGYDLDINLDGQFSNRFFFEDRKDLVFDDGRRSIANWVTNDQGGLLSYTGQSRITSLGEYRERDEDYRGIGLNIDWQVNDVLGVEVDLSYNDTERTQEREEVRFRSNRFFFDWENRGSETFPNIARVYRDFDDPEGSLVDWTANIYNPDDPTNADTFIDFFDGDSRGRNFSLGVTDEIIGARLDFDYLLDHDVFSKIDFGIHLTKRDHTFLGEDGNTFNTPSAERSARRSEVAQSCLIPFPQSDYGEDTASPISQWSTFDTQCAYDFFTGDADVSLDPSTFSSGDVRMEEDITAIYAMATFGTEIGYVTLDGNVGVRFVQTEISSIGTRNSYTVTQQADGLVTFDENDDPESNVFTNRYSSVLPSINLNFGLTDDVQLRFAAYQALSRPDMFYYGAARDVLGDIQEGEEFVSIPAALEGNVRALGNPFLEALTSDNLDISASYYANQDTLFSLALYYKKFNARIVNQNAIEPVVVNGQEFQVEVTGRPTIIDDSSEITGLEFTAQHRFTYLPAPFDSTGVVLSYNFADSNFQTPEAGAQITDDVLATIPAADVPGLSENVLSAQVYWEKDKVSARMQYRFRSEYLKPFGPDLGQTNRIVEDQASLDLDIGYNITDEWIARLQVLNLTNIPYVERRVVEDAFSRIEYSGRRIFLGLRYRL